MKSAKRKIVSEYWKGEPETDAVEKYSSSHRRVKKTTTKTIEWKYYKLECGHEERADLTSAINGMVNCIYCKYGDDD